MAATGLAYQSAALMVRPVTLPYRAYLALLVLGLAMGAVALLPDASGATLLLSTMATAAGLQGVRDSQLANVSVATLPKRTSRIAGFLCGSLFTPLFLPLLPICVLVLGLPHSSASAPAPQDTHRAELHFGRFPTLMVVHQAHYFVYAYTLIFILANSWTTPFPAALGFAIGWITYTLSPVVLDRFHPLPLLVTGHIFVAAMMIVIATHTADRWIVTGAWAAGGIGGGTVFCI
ncbi:MAG: hypothetical protein M3O32_06565, partial [Actinomycetota bacterium]|nr:hypothetical protein [Actinomycetota bacterium]